MVVLGKPMGNGHPMGGLIMGNEIAHAFNNGMEFFSSFGGNPVSMAAGSAVLEVIHQEELQKHALSVGKYFEKIALELSSEMEWVGDVRCRGLFLGIEFTNPENLMPATNLASSVKNGMKENFVLTGTDGPFNNVLKMKPPLCFNKENVDTFFEVFVKVYNRAVTV
jgi:4-aminobutyrate aminotransferase-like enzyme